MSSRDKNLPSEILTLSHFGFKYCSVDGEDSTSNDGNPKNENAKGVLNYSTENYEESSYLPGQICHI